MSKSTVARFKVLIAFLLHLHNVIIRETKNVKNFTKRGKCLSC